MASALDDSVRLLELTRVNPLHHSPSNSPCESSRRPLTLFDTLWIKFSPVERVFFYRLTESTHSLFNSVIVPKLKHSLSLTLLHYLPLAGYLTWPPESDKPLILYTPNDGVSFTVAESSADFDRLTGGGTIPAIDLHHLVPRLNSSDEKAEVMSLQITLFPNQGFSIGQTSHHAALDGNSVTRFTKSWAYICRKISDGLAEKFVPLPEELTPNFDTDLIKDPTRQDLLFLNQWREIIPGWVERSLRISHDLGTIPSDVVRATFEFTPSNIATLRTKIMSKVEHRKKKKQLHLSTYVVVTAYIATCLIRCKQESEDTTILLSCTADFRPRLDPPLPPAYCGNCVGGRASKAKAGDFMDEDYGLVLAVEALSEAVKRVNEGVIEGGEIKVSDFSLPEIVGDWASIRIISVAGSARFGVYESDFGWGGPRKVDMVSMDRTGAISMSESRDVHGGVEASVALKSQEMEAFAALLVDGLKVSLNAPN